MLPAVASTSVAPGASRPSALPLHCKRGRTANGDAASANGMLTGFDGRMRAQWPEKTLHKRDGRENHHANKVVAGPACGLALRLTARRTSPGPGRSRPGSSSNRAARPTGIRHRCGTRRPPGRARLRRRREPVLQRHLRQPGLPNDLGGAVSVFRADSGRTNGNTFNARGRLISCEGAEQGPGGRRRIVRTEMETGKNEVLTERFEGKRYNSPNDVIADARGRIWFTDPFYGDDRSALEMGCRGGVPH